MRIRLKFVGLMVVVLVSGAIPISSVGAIGLSPAKQFVDLAPGDEREAIFTVSRADDRDDVLIDVVVRSVRLVSNSDELLDAGGVFVEVHDSNTLIPRGETRADVRVGVRLGPSVSYGVTYKVVFDILDRSGEGVNQGAVGVIEGVVRDLPEFSSGEKMLSGEEIVQEHMNQEDVLRNTSVYWWELALFFGLVLILVILGVLWRVKRATMKDEL